MEKSQKSIHRSDQASTSRSSNVLNALKTFRVKQVDSAQSLELGPTIAGSLGGVLVALRWGAVIVGLVWAANRAFEGEVRVVLTLSAAIFLASWRTVLPIEFGPESSTPRIQSLIDVTILALATGISDGLGSPFVGCVLVTVAVVGFGWGYGLGGFAAILALLVAPATGIITGATGVNLPSALGVMALAAAAIFPGIARARLLEIEDKRRELAAQRDRLQETNQALETLNELTRSLPSSLDLLDVLASTRGQLAETFKGDRMVVLSLEEQHWAPQIQDGFNLPPRFANDQLPAPIGQAADSPNCIRVNNLSEVCDRSGSGLYGRIVVDGVDTGLVAVEHSSPDFYSEHDAELLHRLTDVLGLTIANAKAFGRLRSLAAADERARIARDLHDRLGQYLTYIALEIERINTDQEEPSIELKVLHEEVQSAINEFRDTLVELRAAVSPQRSLSLVLGEVIERFRKRNQIMVSLVTPEDPTARLSGVMENELLRIAQEALTNVGKHASAKHVHIRWSIENDRGVLVVQDDGRGFDTTKGIRGNAYGLVGMRERAASVGAILEVASEPGQGASITVLTSQPSEGVSP